MFCDLIVLSYLLSSKYVGMDRVLYDFAFVDHISQYLLSPNLI